MNFGKLELNEHIKRKLSMAIDSGTLSHAVLITGGSEKERKAVITLISQALMCKDEKTRPCLKCSTCKNVKLGYHPDITTLTAEMFKKQHIPVDAIRDIRIKAYIKPNEAPYQLFIIPDASQLEAVAQNALLKILEEPPKTARFILGAPSKSVLLTTVLSRVSEYAISEDIVSSTRENPKAMEASQEILTALLTQNKYAMIIASGKLEKDRKIFRQCCEKMMMMLRTALISQYNDIAEVSQLELRLSQKFSAATLISMIELISALITNADANANANLLVTRLTIGLMSKANNTGGKL